MGRREERDAIQLTWMVMREPADRDGNRRARRARLASVRNAPKMTLSVRADDSRDGRDGLTLPESSAPTEGG